MLTLANLNAKYGAIPALHNISLHIANHETVALLGANGAGKSTTLRAISGLLPYQGHITYQEKNLVAVASHQRTTLGIGHVPEGRGIVEQNVHLALQVADRAYVLENGNVGLEGTTAELQENPKIKTLYL